MVRIPGSWSSFDQIEEALTLDELMLLYSTIHESLTSDRKFAASLKGIDLDKNDSNQAESSSFDDVKRRAEARLQGVTEDQLSFAEAGFGFEEEAE